MLSLGKNISVKRRWGMRSSRRVNDVLSENILENVC